MEETDVVADSEGEEIGYPPSKLSREDISSNDTTQSVASRQIRPSSITAATTSFVASLDALLNANVGENATGKPKPRPRPKFRNKEKARAEMDESTPFADTTITPHPHFEADMDFPSILSIADRAKMRQRTTKQLSHDYSYEDELSHSYHVSGGDEEFNDVLSKTKDSLLDDFELHESDPLGSLGKVIYEPNPTIPLQPPGPYTPETRSGPQSPPVQSKPKPRPVKRGNKAKGSPTVEAQQQPTSIPVATSPLPPSDPPLESSPSRHRDTANANHREINGDNLPPIETLPVPTSSPSSLFSAAVGEGEAGDDGLEGDPLLMGPPSTYFKGASSVDKPNQNAHITDTNGTCDDDPRFMEPPSTFFKGASSLDHPSSPKQKEKKRKKREEQVEVIDLCTVPPNGTDVQAIDPKETGKKGKKAKGRENSDDPIPEAGKTKGKSKRKARDDDDFGAFAGDDDDDDYEDGSKRKKTKTKTKGKKSEGKPSTKTKKTVEVIIEVPILKNAGKQKPAELPSVEGGIEQPLARTTADEDRRPGAPNGIGSRVSPVPDSEGEDMQGLFDMEMAAVKSKGTIPTPATGQKRRKRIVYDDEEEEENYDGRKEAEEATSPKKKTKTNRRPTQTSRKSKTRTRGVVLSDNEEAHESMKGTVERQSPEASKAFSDTEGDEASGVYNSVKENIRPHSSGMSSSASKPTSLSHSKTSSPIATGKPNQVKDLDDKRSVANLQPTYTSLTSRYTIAPKTKSAPMNELIRRVNSIPMSPLTSPPRFHAKAKEANKSTSASTPVRSSQGVMAYSPYLKASRSFLSKIAPLHPNRRTPPPPPPPPPPKKKSKKELELEEKWEEELVDSIGGPAAWSCLSEDERKAMKRHKWAVERGEIDD